MIIILLLLILFMLVVMGSVMIYAIALGIACWIAWNLVQWYRRKKDKKP